MPAEMGINMNYAEIKYCDIANGPGVRTSLFVSGCTHHCPGCFNEIAWDFEYGKPFTQETIDAILASLEPGYIAGLTLLGGEPFEYANQQGLLPLLQQTKSRFPQKNIWCFTGYLFDKDICGQMCEKWDVTREMLSYIDVLVDGKFMQELKSLNLKFKGSSNQRTILVQESLAKGDYLMNTIVKLKKLTPNAIIPTYGTAQSAGADLYSGMEQPVTIEPGKTEFIHTGIAIAIPEGLVGLVYARSGMACKKGIAPANKVGVIDADYRGEIMVALYNHGNEAVTVEPGDRIAQLVLTPFITAAFDEADSLDETDRGNGGFGSTGTK